MRDTANKHRRDVQFAVGDMVLLKLQQYRQHSVARPQSAKLARHFYGPFKVIERIGAVAYRLQLPPQCRVHDVFHVSLLRPFVSESVADNVIPLPEEFFMSRPVVKPIRLLERRVVMQNEKLVEQGLFQWSDSLDSPPTWEPISSFSRRFSSLFLEDKDSSIGGGVDTTPTTSDTVAHGQETTQDSTDEVLTESTFEVQSRRIRMPPIHFKDYVDC